MSRRAVILVLDGCGIGAMPDSAPAELGRHTLAHISENGSLELPTLASLGLGCITPTGIDPVAVPLAAYGRCAPVHPGADTYMGHQEIMGGGLSMVEFKLMKDLSDCVTAALEAAGHRVEPMVVGQPMLLVDGCALVADNIEARARLNINVTASLDDISFEDLTIIGLIVRKAIQVSRVIVVGGRGFTIDDIRANIRTSDEGHVGVDTPELGVYNEHYQVRHLGLDFPIERQLPTRVREGGGSVVLLGKAADVVRCEGALAENLVATDDVFDAVLRHLDAMTEGLIVANVQETDLAGHEEDPHRYRRVLRRVDARLPEVMSRLTALDILLITADHGNDPTSGSSRHTREYVPVLAYGAQFSPVDLGIRSTLADVGATVAELFDLLPLDSGTSFAKEILCSST